MQAKQRIPYLFVINSGSGTNNDINYSAEIRSFLKVDHADSPEAIIELEKDFKPADIEKKIRDINPKKLIALGGDGTVTMLANMAVGTDIELGIVPCGSANGMAKELNITENFQDALQLIRNGAVKEIDMIEISGHNYCLHLADIGLNAHLIKHFDEGKLRGKLGYGLVILKTLWRKRKMKINVCTDDKEVVREAYMVALANAKKYGTGAVINPEGKLNDGEFEIIIVRRLAVGPLLQMLLKPGRFNPKKIEIMHCTSVTLEADHAMHFQVDGEYKGRLKSVEAKIRKAAVKVIVPAQNTESNAELL